MFFLSKTYGKKGVFVELPFFERNYLRWLLLPPLFMLYILYFAGATEGKKFSLLYISLRRRRFLISACTARKYKIRQVCIGTKFEFGPKGAAYRSQGTLFSHKTRGIKKFFYAKTWGIPCVRSFVRPSGPHLKLKGDPLPQFFPSPLKISNFVPPFVLPRTQKGAATFMYR